MLRPKHLIVYFLALLADILLIAFDKEEYRYATKPLLMILLAVYTLYTNIKMPRSFRIFLLLALFFSSLGDDLLLFDHLFLPGLGSFFIAQIMYCIFFLKIRYSNLPVPLCRYPYILLNAAVIILFLLFLLPHLGSLAVPVIAYAIALFFLVQCVLHAFHFSRQPTGWYSLVGAILFVISDALIATGKFYRPLPAGDILVMLTYGFAQWGLVYGSTEYFRVKINR
ncbi:lysoplasmalogenase family protein [Chitinophaga sp. OAE865]|uniref:lysoplasmalogenase n=1 Tax=Chitinophaga sp. OAE865 TaxID=2817898 RepID=UPI001AE1BD7E